MITLDTGALIAAERRKRTMLAFLTEALRSGALITVPTCVVGEWCEAMAAVRGATLVDSVVVASAAQRRDLILTQDVDDLSRIRDRVFPRVRIRAV